MKFKINKAQNRFSIAELTPIELDVILAVIYTADKRCFREQEESGEWYSGNDFILSLTDEQRTALANMGERIDKLYNQ